VSPPSGPDPYAEKRIVNTFSSRRLFVTGALISALGFTAVLPALAHEAKCPVCKLDVVQDTDKLDNEVAIRSGRKRIEYRCVYCALTDAKTYAGDITVLAPSETKGKPVVLSRKAGKWTAAPDTAVFVAQKVTHRHCEIGYRALSSQVAFDKWVKANPGILENAKPLTLAGMLEVAK
jgi:hypothetical protein